MEKGFTVWFTGLSGVSDPYEPPLNPEVTAYTARETPWESVAKIMTALSRSIRRRRRGLRASLTVLG